MVFIARCSALDYLLVPGGQGTRQEVGNPAMLAFIASVAGEHAAGQVQFNAEYYPSAVSYGGFEKHAQAPAYVRPSGSYKEKQ